MANWQLTLGLDERPRAPLFERIAQAIRADILSGRLRPGAKLPGSRALARQLLVHRNTVLAAARELVSQGWLTTDPARSTRVAATLPETSLGIKRRKAKGRSFDIGGAVRPSMPISPEPKGLLMYGGLPDLRLFPTDVFARANRSLLQHHAQDLLNYGPVAGHPKLRQQLARMLADTRGLAVTAEEVFVTRGSQMGLWLVFRVLLKPGDTVAVEALGYRPAWDAMRAHAAKLVPVPVDDEGLCIPELEAVAKRGRLRAVYVTPHHQYPTLATLSARRRLELLALALRYRFAIVEDDYDHEYHYAGRPVLPLATADQHGSVIYIGTLSKVLAPALRIGYVVASGDVLDRLATVREALDRQGDMVTEATAAELMEDGEVQRHAWRTKREYAHRRGVLVRELERHLASELCFQLPTGGMALWARVAPDLDGEKWVARAAELGVHVMAGRRFTFDGSAVPYLRLGFAPLNEAEICRAVLVLKRAASRARVG